MSRINPVGNPNFLQVPAGNIQVNLASWASYILDIMLLIAGILAVFSLIYAGLLYITSAGRPEQSKKARASIIHTIIGIIIIVSSYFLIKLAISVGTGISNALPL